MIPKLKYLALFVLLPLFGLAQVAPFMGLGNAQFFDNNGEPLTAGVLYSYQAGTSTQQATYTDATGHTLNPNPIPFGSGARVSIWLTSGAYYKFVLCLQNDGPFCAPADVLFSVDQVPGAPAGSGSSSGSPFISGSSNPATTGILRLASGDAICWRNAAGTANLCIHKDSSDVLAWDGGAMKFPEVPCANSGTGFDYLCADSTAHRWKMSGNGGSQLVVAAQGQDINSSDFVTQLHFGSTPAPLSSSAPSTGQGLCWNGTQIAGCNPVEQVFSFLNGFPVTITNSVPCALGTGSVCAITTFASAHAVIRFTYSLITAPAGCTVSPVYGIVDLTSSTNLYTVTITNGASVGYQDSGALSLATTAGHAIGVGLLTNGTTCSTWPTFAAMSMVYQ